LFVVEGRISGRWWVWQRFRSRDEGARELAALAIEKRFDGVRLVQTIPGGVGVSTTSRELVVVDAEGVHGPDRTAPQASEHADPPTPPREAPAPARQASPQRGQPKAQGRPSRRREPFAPPPVPFQPPQGSVAAEGELARTGARADIRIEPVVVDAEPEPDIGHGGGAAMPLAFHAAQRNRRRQIVYTLGAGVASLLLAVVSYEITRTVVGMPDLLYEARQAAAAVFAGPERPIIAAARQGNTEEIGKLLRGGFSPNTEDAYGVPALLVAARAGKAGVVRQLLEAGADPNRAFRRGDTPLLASAREGLTNAIELMLAKGGHVNGRGGGDLCDTPLLVAAAAGRIETVNYLLGKGASFDVLPGCRRGPLDAAAAYPRVREALEQAYQRRLAAAGRSGQPAPAAMPAAATMPHAAPAAPSLPTPAPVDRPPTRQPAAAVPPPVQAKPHAAAANASDANAPAAAYRAVMFGLGWDDTLAQVRAKSKNCREVGKRYIACELAVKKWLDDIETVEAWFDRADGDRFVSMEARSAAIVDTSAKLDGQSVRQRFDKVRAAIEKKLPEGLRPIIARQAAAGIPFFAGLKPDVNAGDYSVFWPDDGRRHPAAVHLKLTGTDDQSGYYRVVISNPNRYSQQAQIDPSKR
jgi:hypothetical protein